MTLSARTRPGPNPCRFRQIKSLRRERRCASLTRRFRPAIRDPPSRRALSNQLEKAASEAVPDIREMYAVLRGGKALGEITFNALSAKEKSLPLLLSSLDELHFLDWHACALIAGSGAPAPKFILHHSAAEHLLSRIAAELIDESKQEFIAYQRGAVLAGFLALKDWPALWHNYLTSRDARREAPRRLLAGETLSSPFPHLRAGFVTGIDLFHAGEYYAAHEDWESLWVRLDEGPERRAAQGLIQLAGAHIHRLKGRVAQAKQLYEKARSHLTFAGPTLDWLDTEELLARADAAFTCAEATDNLPWPIIPLRNLDLRLPRKHS